MMTYLVLNVLFIASVLLLLWVRPRRPSNAWWVTLVVLLVLTAVFDSMLVSFNIVGYDTSKLLGVYIGAAPVEDFFYTLLAVIIVPVLWHRKGRVRAPKSS